MKSMLEESGAGKIENSETAVSQFDPRLLLAALGAFSLGYIILPALSAFTGFLMKGNPAGTVCSGMIGVVGPLASVAAVFILVKSYSGSFRETLQALGFKHFPVRMLWYAFPLALAIMIAGGGVTLLWSTLAELCNIQFGVPPTVAAALSRDSWLVTALLVTALLAAPVFEEIFFRRALFDALRYFLPGWAAVILASLAFAAMHMSLLQLPGLWLMGALWQKIYLKNGTLYSSVILHFFNNVIAVIMLLIVRCMGLEATILSL